MDQNKAKFATVQISKPINWIIPDSIRTEYATNLVIQQRGSEFILLFFEVQPPVFTGTPQEQFAATEAIDSIDAKCIAKFVMSVENMTLAANSVIEAVNQFNEMLMLATKENENANASASTTNP